MTRKEAMYVQVVTYGLAGISESEYLSVANDIAARFSAMPGLQAKLWLENPGQGRYGAIYLWDDRESMERFLHSGLFEAANTTFADVESEGFSVLENLTAQTQPVLEVIEPRRRPAAARQDRVAPATRVSPLPAPGAGGARKIPVSTSAPAKKASAKKAPAKKASANKASAKKAPTKKAPAQKAPAKKAPAKKASGIQPS
ncbi:MAG: YdhR family protein [Actinomycetota bacterium]|nr:YdhR family protein [Actinomycetota bacterium]